MAVLATAALRIELVMHQQGFGGSIPISQPPALACRMISLLSHTHYRFPFTASLPPLPPPMTHFSPSDLVILVNIIRVFCQTADILSTSHQLTSPFNSVTGGRSSQTASHSTSQ
ncbi:unnamed protein product [Pleuronectes platessa]|uniref:Uncharacterized protein n=1 Tax=Pleuronectes platessa TaxID=8262 RepID=A0A9N7YQL2_PLEPL|nr:unnamed protein product [Pleuronectes platessa]